MGSRVRKADETIAEEFAGKGEGGGGRKGGRKSEIRIDGSCNRDAEGKWHDAGSREGEVREEGNLDPGMNDPLP